MVQITPAMKIVAAACVRRTLKSEKDTVPDLMFGLGSTVNVAAWSGPYEFRLDDPGSEPDPDGAASSGWIDNPSRLSDFSDTVGDEPSRRSSGGLHQFRPLVAAD